jgi:hypothetical protein
MGGGGHVTGHALSAGAHIERAVRALQALADPQAFAARYAVPAGTPPMLFAVGDGNHSLATAKSIWEQAKATVGLHHPSRYALVEVVNIHDPALALRADPPPAVRRAPTCARRWPSLRPPHALHRGASGEAMRQRLKDCRRRRRPSA